MSNSSPTTATLALPAQSSALETDVPVNSSISLDHLGPIVVQADGSMMRISDWASKTDHEKEMIQRVIAKRNKQRMDALLEAQSNSIQQSHPIADMD
jgi:hypothetical protein